MKRLARLAFAVALSASLLPLGVREAALLCNSDEIAEMTDFHLIRRQRGEKPGSEAWQPSFLDLRTRIGCETR